MSTTEPQMRASDVVEVATKGGRTRAPETLEVPHLSVAERAARGRAARAQVPRSSHADYASASQRSDPVELLQSQAASRVPELVPIRYGRMLVSPFTFYRGAALLWRRIWPSTPGLGVAGPVVWGRASLELRGVRVTGSTVGVRSQRLRRDASGTVGVGREAVGGELRGGRSRERILRPRNASRSCGRRSRRTARPCASSRGCGRWTCGIRGWISMNWRLSCKAR